MTLREDIAMVLEDAYWLGSDAARGMREAESSMLIARGYTDRIIALVREDERKRKATRNCHTAKSSTSAQRRPAMYDRHEMHTDAADSISAMGWMQTEFSWIADPEEIVDAVVPIVWQAAIDFIYQQPMTLNRDTLIERMKRWMEADNGR